MADFENIILDHLTTIRGDVVRVMDGFSGMRTESAALRQHVASFHTMQEHHSAEIATLRARLDRVERRLDNRE